MAAAGRTPGMLTHATTPTRLVLGLQAAPLLLGLSTARARTLLTDDVGALRPVEAAPSRAATLVRLVGPKGATLGSAPTGPTTDIDGPKRAVPRTDTASTFIHARATRRARRLAEEPPHGTPPMESYQRACPKVGARRFHTRTPQGQAVGSFNGTYPQKFKAGPGPEAGPQAGKSKTRCRNESATIRNKSTAGVVLDNNRASP